MPAFFGSLVVVPIILIGHTLKQSKVGFIAALIGSVTWSYYNRTMIGYYDTDMLNIVFPMMVLWALMFSIIEQKNRYLILVVVLMLLSAWWYPKNDALNSAMVFMALIYAFVFHKKELFNYKLFIFALIALAIIPVWIKLFLVIVIFCLFHFRPELGRKTVIPLLIISIFVYITSGALNNILSSVNLYLVNRLFAEDLPQLFFYDVINTVREAGAISFETFANRISGSIITFLLASIGVNGIYGI
jgi:dolichyl-diphosphooligosaccharide--protein glycosyltransferase/undecaprenyl-diphosphooligosaccharide--protein glycosyltransferase